MTRASPPLAPRPVRGPHRALVDDARRYGGARVLLRIVDEGDAVRFEVDDDGPGFAAGDEERAFEPFWRGTQTSHRTRGVGLGLALVRQIVEAHRGTAGARNHEAGGRVWLSLPRGRDLSSIPADSRRPAS